MERDNVRRDEYTSRENPSLLSNLSNVSKRRAGWVFEKNDKKVFGHGERDIFALYAQMDLRASYLIPSTGNQRVIADNKNTHINFCASKTHSVCSKTKDEACLLVYSINKKAERTVVRGFQFCVGTAYYKKVWRNLKSSFYLGIDTFLRSR